jgi:hypothetical protein
MSLHGGLLFNRGSCRKARSDKQTGSSRARRDHCLRGRDRNDILASFQFPMDRMRRLFVIFVIFLFPLQVFAGSSASQLPTHTIGAGHLLLSEATSSDAGEKAAFEDISAWDASEELPAGADVNDALGQDSYLQQADCLACSRPQYTPPSMHLLFLPVVKPPPIF